MTQVSPAPKVLFLPPIRNNFHSPGVCQQVNNQHKRSKHRRRSENIVSYSTPKKHLLNHKTARHSQPRLSYSHKMGRSNSNDSLDKITHHPPFEIPILYHRNNIIDDEISRVIANRTLTNPKPSLNVPFLSGLTTIKPEPLAQPSNDTVVTSNHIYTTEDNITTNGPDNSNKRRKMTPSRREGATCSIVLTFNNREEDVQMLRLRSMFEVLLQENGFSLKFMRSKLNACLTHMSVAGSVKRLMVVGEQMGIYMPVKDQNFAAFLEEVEDDEEPGWYDKLMSFFETDQEVDYISAPFRWDKKELFAGIEDPDTFFRSSLRSFLTHHILIRTDVSKKKDIQDGINIRGLNYLKLKGVYTDVFILHDRPSTLHRRKAFKEKDDDQLVVDPRTELWESWRKWYKFQPLWKIRNYFGEKIAFYFAWIGLYSQSLILPTILGLIIFVLGLDYRWSVIENATEKLAAGNITESVSTQIYEVFTIFNNPATPWFSLILCLWGTWFVEQWKRKSNSLKYEWDVSNFEQLEPDRPQFYGSKTRKNPITEEEEWFYPFYKLYLKISVSTVTVTFMVLLVVASTLGVIVFRAASNAEKLITNGENNSLYTSFISSVINATIIMLLGWGYEKIAYFLTNWENHRTQTAYDDALIIKLFAFQFVNNYASLCYIAFFKGYVAENGMFGYPNFVDTCDFEQDGKPVCYPMLVMQVAVLLCMKPMPKFFKDVVIPFLIHQFRKFRNRFRNGDTLCCCCFSCCCSCIRPDNIEAIDAGPEKTKELLDIIEEDRRLISGDVDFTLSEYTEKTIMYGMIVLFGAVFPLAPLIALICNLIDIRVDAYRILWKNRRYIAQRAEDIGIWQYILEFLNIVGVVVNSLIIALSLEKNGSFLDNYSNRWMVAFAFEHVIFSFKFIVAYIIPDVPSDVQFKMRKEQFQVNQLFEKGPTKKASVSENTKV